MKVGLLECDHVREELLHIAGDYNQMFPSLFSKVAPDWEFEFYDVCNNVFPDSADACDIYICTGSKNSVYDNEPWILRLMEFVREIKNTGKIYIGVCFGHQLLGEALGGRIQKAEVGWCVGVHHFEILKFQNWMLPARSSFDLLMMCQDQVVELPEGAVLLAETSDCPFAMFQVGDNMMGIQAHPEFPKAYDQALMELRVERIGNAKVDLGIASLELPTHEIVIAEWIKNFAAMK